MDNGKTYIYDQKGYPDGSADNMDEVIFEIPE